MIEERKWRTSGKGVQPQGDFGEFYRHRVLVYAIDAAFQNEALDQILVGELIIAHDPPVSFGFGANTCPHVSEPPHQWRDVISPGDRVMRFAHQDGHMFSEVIHERYQKVTRSHGWIDDLEIEHRFRRIERVQFYETEFCAAPIAS